MSRENVELAGSFIPAWHEGAPDALLPFCPKDVVWYPVPEWPDGAEPRVGHDGIRELMYGWVENFDVWAPVVNEVRDLGDRVLVLGEMGGIKGSGVPIRQPLGWVCSDFRDGQIGEIRFFLTWREALEAAGLRE